MKYQTLCFLVLVELAVSNSQTKYLLPQQLKSVKAADLHNNDVIKHAKEACKFVL